MYPLLFAWIRSVIFKIGGYYYQGVLRYFRSFIIWCDMYNVFHLKYYSRAVCVDCILQQRIIHLKYDLVQSPFFILKRTGASETHKN